MKFFAIFALFIVAFVALVQSAPAEDAPGELAVGGTSEAIELFGGEGRSRQRICTAALCRAVCGALGYRWAWCNPQRYCICSR